MENELVLFPVFYNTGGIKSKADAFKRGGNWDNTSNAGVFTLNLNNAPANTNANIGFRCAQTVLPVRDHLAVTGTQLSTIKNDLYIGGNIGIATTTPTTALIETQQVQ